MPYTLEKKEFYTLVQKFEDKDFITADFINIITPTENYILDFSRVDNLTEELLAFLDQLDQQIDTFAQSLVIINNNKPFISSLEEAFPTLNISPTLIEAEDIVKMELLEREILNGEDDEF